MRANRKAWCEKTVVTFVITGLMLAWAGTAQATTIIRVDADSTAQNPDGSTWALAFKYLQDGLDYADDPNNGVDEIWVAEGTYWPDEDANDPNGTGQRAVEFQLIDGVEMYGGFDGSETTRDQRDWENNVTILSGDLDDDDDPNDPFQDNDDNSCHVVWSSGVGDDTVLDGFTITGGNADGDISSGAGIWNTGDLQVANCRFEYNAATGSGGAMSNGVNAGTITPAITSCVFEHNMALNTGGAMSNWSNGDATITDCRFSDNKAGSDDHSGDGGAMAISGSAPYVEACTFDGNVAVKTDPAGAGGRGGAVWIWYGSATGQSQFVRCTFSGNSAEGYPYTAGGAVYILEPQPHTPDLRPEFVNCAFTDNLSENGSGGAVCEELPCEALYVNCLFAGNTADGDPNDPNDSCGGAIAKWLGGGASPTSTIRNCTFCNNEAQDRGGAVWVAWYCTANIYNSILWDDTPCEISITPGGTATVTYSDVEGGWPGTGNIDQDPNFAADYYLEPNSPCIDAANNGNLPADQWDLDHDGNVAEDVPYFLDGNPRKVDGNDDQVITVDMGAREYKPCVGDLDGDGDTDRADLGILLSAWGTDGNGDLDGDADTDHLDLGILLADYPCP
jgi:hypothetical protein